MSQCVKVIGEKTTHHCPPPPSPPHPPACPSACSHQDYVLSEGAQIHVDPGKEVKQDFVLSANIFKDCGTISGEVMDKHGRPIENALVKIFDHEHNPFAHVFTNKKGQFLVCVPPGNYIIKAVR